MTTRCELTLQALVPLESYRSPLVPTGRFGEGLLVGISAPLRATSPVPSWWYIVDPVADEVAAFARTAVISPVATAELAMFSARPGSAAGRIHPRDAHTQLRTQGPGAHEAFTAGSDLPRGLAADLLGAYEVTIPNRLQPWLWTCCADYFGWLGKQATTP